MTFWLSIMQKCIALKIFIQTYLISPGCFCIFPYLYNINFHFGIFNLSTSSIVDCTVKKWNFSLLELLLFLFITAIIIIIIITITIIALYYWYYFFLCYCYYYYFYLSLLLLLFLFLFLFIIIIIGERVLLTLCLQNARNHNNYNFKQNMSFFKKNFIKEKPMLTFI